MTYSKEFENLVYSDQRDFIGVGNPNAKILIVGKESAIEEDNDKQKNLEIEDNVKQWRYNIKQNVDLSEVASLHFDDSDINYKYNPLYPYKGQEYKVRTIISERSKGTSKTWYQYQKLWDFIMYGQDGKHSGLIDYHEHCFSTELSTAAEKYSLLVDDAKRSLSIEQRKLLFTHSFYQSFPIVILAVGHYPLNHNIDLESIFHTKWDGKTNPIGKFWYNIHHTSTDNPKLLIHTNQLSMVSNDLIKAIAKECRDFASENSILFL